MDLLSNSLKPLAKMLEKQDPKPLALVGTGVSIGATSAAQSSWLGLLKHGIDYLVETKKFTIEWGNELKTNLDSAFFPFDLDKALRFAELVEQNLSTPAQPKAFENWLTNSFSDFKAQPNKTNTLEAIRDLQKSGVLIVTTNYDNLLSDVTGVSPVTWEEHADFLSAINNRDRILHIHGHWKRPSSIILGKSSYDRIVADEDFQVAFKSLWMHWSWMYVGCGDGLDDPNVGSLLRWGKRWGDHTPHHYFLAKTDKAIAIESRPDKPINLFSVPYEEYSDLPNVLRSVTPTVRCYPFVLVAERFRWFRDPKASPLDPFPSRQEFLDGKVPKLSMDNEVVRRLNEHNWAFVLDVASVGKTALALRIATSVEQRNHPVFHLDLANVDEDAGEDVSAAMKRLSRQNILLVIDNAHYRPEIARQLWDQWRDNPSDSKLLIIATKVQRYTKVSPDQDLVFFEKHIDNPAVKLRPTEGDLENILNHIYFRVVESHSTKSMRSLPSRLKPSPDALKTWHKDYGNALGAFCLAVLSRLSEFERGNWELSRSIASEWIKEKWLKSLDSEYIENLLCLSVFGAQEFELNVFEEALPYPEKTPLLMNRGLVIRVDSGNLGQYHRYSLREPEWGSLILESQSPKVDEEKLLFTTASRDARVARSLSNHLYAEKTSKRFEDFWLFISRHPKHILDVYNRPMPLPIFLALVRYAVTGKQLPFVDSLWDAIESNPEKLAERAWETSLQELGSFLEVAKKHGRDTSKLWDAIESDPEKLAERAWETSLAHVGSFLEVAKKHGRDTNKLWDAIESDPEKLAERAWETSLAHVGSFLEVAKKHGRDTSKLWDAIESVPEKLAERAWETSLEDIGSFLEVAKKHERDTSKLWAAIESEPQKLAERAWEISLDKVGSFLDVAKKHGRDTSKLWAAIESDPEKLAERAWETSLADVGSFLEVAKKHGRDTSKLWDAIESDPEKLAERAWETSLQELGSFLEVAKKHGRDISKLWAAIESDPEKLAERAWETSLADVGSFLEVAIKQERDIGFLWESFESDAPRLFLKAKNDPINDVAGFCKRAPDGLVRKLLDETQSNYWDGILTSESLNGVIGLSVRCGEVGREDLKATIITKILTRKIPEDFLPGSLPAVALMLGNLSETHVPLLSAFLDSICTKRWLGWQYNVSPGYLIANGLYMLALNQPARIYKRFYNVGLDIRLEKEFSRITLVTPQEQGNIVKLLGSAVLIGRSFRKEMMHNVSLNMVGNLPISAFPHQPDSVKVELWQFQLWLGLRGIASITNKPLPVSAVVINQTLDLWRKNFEESSLKPKSAEHYINANMVSWLEDCSRKNKGLLPAPLLKSR